MCSAFLWLRVLYGAEPGLPKLTDQALMRAIEIAGILGFESQFDRIDRIVKIWIGPQHQIRKIRQNVMKDSRDLSLVGAQVNFAKMKWSLSKHLLDAFKLAPQNLGNSRKDINILDGNNGEPHTFATDQPAAVRHIGQSQITVENIPALILAARRHQLPVALNTAPASRRTTVRGHALL